MSTAIEEIKKKRRGRKSWATMQIGVPPKLYKRLMVLKLKYGIYPHEIITESMKVADIEKVLAEKA